MTSSHVLINYPHTAQLNRLCSNSWYKTWAARPFHSAGLRLLYCHVNSVEHQNLLRLCWVCVWRFTSLITEAAFSVTKHFLVQNCCVEFWQCREESTEEPEISTCFSTQSFYQGSCCFCSVCAEWRTASCAQFTWQPITQQPTVLTVLHHVKTDLQTQTPFSETPSALHTCHITVITLIQGKSVHPLREPTSMLIYNPVMTLSDPLQVILIEFLPKIPIFRPD